MRSYSPAELTHLQSRDGTRARLLVWIIAKNRTTGLPEPAGFWNGDDTQEFTIDGAARTYFGAGGLLGMDDLVIEPGVKVRRMSIWFNSGAPEVVNAVMAYDVRLAPVQIHRVLTDPVSHQVIAVPHRIWKGVVDGNPRTTAPKGLSNGRISLNVMSNAFMLTRSLSAKYSDEALKLRGGDRIGRYIDVSGKVPVYWGEDKFETKKTSVLSIVKNGLAAVWK